MSFINAICILIRYDGIALRWIVMTDPWVNWQRNLRSGVSTKNLADFPFFIWLHGHIDISPRLIKVFWYDHMTMRNVRPVDPLAISGRVLEAWSAVSYRRRRHAFFFTVNVQKAKKITINGKPPFWSWSLTWSHSEDARTLNAHKICWSCIQSGKVNNTCKQKKDKKVNYYSRYFCCRSDG